MRRRLRLLAIGACGPGARLWGGGSLARAAAAGRRCLAAGRRRRSDVGLLIHAGVSRDHHVCEPAQAVLIQQRLGINVEFHGARTLAFDVTAGGCGMLAAAEVAWALLQEGTLRCALVTASEGNADWRAKGDRPCPASGTALLLELSPGGEGFGAFAFHQRGEWAGLATTAVSLAEARGRLRVARHAQLEERWLEMAGPVVDDVLAQGGLRREQINRVVPAQISSPFLARLPEAIGIPPGRIADYSGDLPDTLSTSLFLALERELQQRPARPGQIALLLAFGSGLTAAAAAYHY